MHIHQKLYHKLLNKTKNMVCLTVLLSVYSFYQPPFLIPWVHSFWLEFQPRVATLAKRTTCVSTRGVTSRSSFHSCFDGEGNTRVEPEVIQGVTIIEEFVTNKQVKICQIGKFLTLVI